MVICAASVLKGMEPVVVNVKSDLQPGLDALRCAQGKVECIAVGSAGCVIPA